MMTLHQPVPGEIMGMVGTFVYSRTMGGQGTAAKCESRWELDAS